MSRQDLFMSVKIKQLKVKDDIFRELSATPDAQGCEICKPAIGSILSSLYNEHVMKPQHHHNQDTNDRFLGNIQRNGTFSVVPRIPGGEVTPERLVAIGKVASEYKLYTKITGGQRIDMFGAQKQDLPAIWTKLHEAGLESGQSFSLSLVKVPVLIRQDMRMESRCVQSRVVSGLRGVDSE
jgi:nitrite reductase (NAD(P)H)